MWKTFSEARRDPTFSYGQHFSRYTYKVDDKEREIGLELLPQIEDNTFKIAFTVKQGDQQTTLFIYAQELKRLAHTLNAIGNFIEEMECAPTFNPKNEY